MEDFTGLITVREAAERIGCSTHQVRYLIRNETLFAKIPGKGRRPTWLLERSVERYLKLNEYQRRKRLLSANNAHRYYADVSQAYGEVVPTRTAALFARVNVDTLTHHAQMGDLITYRQAGDRRTNYYSLNDLRSFANRMAAWRDLPRKFVKPAHHRPGTKPNVQWHTTVEEGDLQPWERNLHDFLPYYTPRQAAYELGISLNALGQLRRRGRLTGQKMANLRGFGPSMIYYQCAEVRALGEDDYYNFHRHRARPGLCAALRKAGADEQAPGRLAK